MRTAALTLNGFSFLSHDTDFLFSPVVIWSGRVLHLCFLTGLRGEVRFGRPAGTAAGGGGATALVGRQAVVEARRRHTLSCGFITHTLQLVAHRGALTCNQFNTNLYLGRSAGTSVGESTYIVASCCHRKCEHAASCQTCSPWS